MLFPVVETTPGGRTGSHSQKLYQVAQSVLSVETESRTDWVHDFVPTFLQGFHITPAEKVDPALPQLRLLVKTEAPSPLSTSAECQQFEIPGGVCHAGPESYVLDTANACIVVAEQNARLVTIYLHETDYERGKAGAVTALAYGVPAALRRCGLYDLHAAGMVAPASRAGYVFAGNSGSGKTTLSLRLGAAGWGFMSDDLLLVSVGKEGIETRPFRRPFQSDAPTLAGCDLPKLVDALGPTIPTDPTKRKLDPEIVFPGQFASVASPRVLCFPEVGNCDTTIVEPMNESIAMLRLLQMCPWASYDRSAARDHLAVLSSLVKQTKAFAIRAGRDIYDDPSYAGRLFSSLA